MSFDIIGDLQRDLDAKEQLLCRIHAALRELRKELVAADNSAVAVMSTIRTVDKLLDLYPHQWQQQ